ncbi:MAG: GNAT family N-acetyltransferase [Candidatus Pacearchaeota archaeon]
MGELVTTVIKASSFQERDKALEILKKIKEFNDRDILTCLYVFDNIGNGEYEGFSAYANDKLVGFILFTKNSLALDVFELLWIVVDPDWQGNGIGSLLMEKFLEEMKIRNARIIILHTSEHYLKAKSLYKKYNFNCEAVIKDFYDIGDSKEIWVLRLK